MRMVVMAAALGLLVPPVSAAEAAWETEETRPSAQGYADAVGGVSRQREGGVTVIRPRPSPEAAARNANRQDDYRDDYRDRPTVVVIDRGQAYVDDDYTGQIAASDTGGDTGQPGNGGTAFGGVDGPQAVVPPLGAPVGGTGIASTGTAVVPPMGATGSTGMRGGSR
jgi:hypothetical protein